MESSSPSEDRGLRYDEETEGTETGSLESSSPSEDRGLRYATCAGRRKSRTGSSSPSEDRGLRYDE